MTVIFKTISVLVSTFQIFCSQSVMDPDF